MQNTEIKTVNRDKEGRFLVGNKTFGGRKPGARGKLSTLFFDELYRDFQAHGAAAIVKCRETKPAMYMRVIASLIPREIKITHNPFGELSDDEIAHLIDVVQRAECISLVAEDRVDAPSIETLPP